MKNRAKELAARAYARCVEDMTRQLRDGTLSEETIEFWEPDAAVRVKQQLDRARHELDVARGVAEILP